MDWNRFKRTLDLITTLSWDNDNTVHGDDDHVDEDDDLDDGNDDYNGDEDALTMTIPAPALSSCSDRLAIGTHFSLIAIFWRLDDHHYHNHDYDHHYHKHDYHHDYQFNIEWIWSSWAYSNSHDYLILTDLSPSYKYTIFIFGHLC